MTSFSILGVFILALSSSISGNVLLPRDAEECGGSLFVDDAIVIDVPLSANCKWRIQTEKDRVLVFTVVQGGNFKQVEEFLSIHDGMEVDSSVLLFENRMVHEVSNKELPEAVYTTGSVAEVRLKKEPISVLKLKIQKAVSCPFNLGADSQCGRVVDEISCYCVTFAKRDHASQTSYCNSHSMKLLAIESYAEELAIQSAWGTTNSEVCGELLYVEDEIVIDLSLYGNCDLKIKTDEDHILAFSLVDGQFEEVQEYITIHDGFDENSPILLIENQMRHEIGRTNAESISSVYTTSSNAKLRFQKAPTATLKLKIQKAVNCPFNLGPETQCGRVVDDSSCYCATFTKRSQSSQASFCKTNAMNLLAIESYTEESKIYAAWGATVYLWTSLTDLKLEGTWIWESTNASLYPGYANWAALEPNNIQDTEEDCVYIRNGWYDYPCNYSNDAICELQPVIQ